MRVTVTITVRHITVVAFRLAISAIPVECFTCEGWVTLAVARRDFTRLKAWPVPASFHHAVWATIALIGLEFLTI